MTKPEERLDDVYAATALYLRTVDKLSPRTCRSTPCSPAGGGLTWSHMSRSTRWAPRGPSPG